MDGSSLRGRCVLVCYDFKPTYESLQGVDVISGWIRFHPGSQARKLSLTSAAVDKHSAAHAVDSWGRTDAVWEPGYDIRDI